MLQKPKIISLSSSEDVMSIFTKIAQAFTVCYLFESIGEGDLVDENHYTYIGFDPDHLISAREKSLSIDGKKSIVKNPYLELKNFLPISHEKFFSGLIGYLGYDTVNYFEPRLNVKSHPDFSTFTFGLYTDGLIYNNKTHQLSYFYTQQNRVVLIKRALSQKIKSTSTKTTFLAQSLTEDQHAAGVNKILSEIKAGNTFQTQFGFKYFFKIEGDHLAIYKALRKISPSPYLYYLKFGTQTLLGASPELLFRLTDGLMETFPLAGTIRRGKTIEEDQQLAKKLLNDPKEIAEHNMLVDLHRNDIGKVAQFGSVKVRKLKEIKKFSHVQHISSEITGQLQPTLDMFTALASNFPAGTLSGAPKIESIKIISQTETQPRGPYGGAVGYFGFDQNCAFSIPIRSLFIHDQTGYIQASGGIVADSKPADEYAEIKQKLVGMRAVLEQFEKGDI